MNAASRFELVQLPNGAHAIRDCSVGELCHPTVGPVVEAKSLYVSQLNLQDRMLTNNGEFVIWDVGLGGAANVLTAITETSQSTSPLRVVSFDQSTALLQFAVEHADKLGYFGEHEPSVRKLIDAHESTFVNGSREIHWTYHEGDFPTLLRSGKFGSLTKPHAIFFDAYSPRRNPEMWTLEVFTRIFYYLDPTRPCQLPTYSRSTLMRVTLLLAGFYVGRGRPSGTKEETTIAANDPTLIINPLDQEWLERAKRSNNAEPFHSTAYVNKPLSDDSLNKLLEHPQFGARS